MFKENIFALSSRKSNYNRYANNTINIEHIRNEKNSKFLCYLWKGKSNGVTEQNKCWKVDKVSGGKRDLYWG